MARTNEISRVLRGSVPSENSLKRTFCIDELCHEHADSMVNCGRARIHFSDRGKRSEAGFSGWLLSDLLSVSVSKQGDSTDSIDWIDTVLGT